MRIISILFLLIIISCSRDNTTTPVIPNFLGEVESIRTFGGTKNEEARSVIATQDGGYAILGTTRSMDGDVSGKTDENNDFWLLKFNAEDELEWNKTYGGTGVEKGQKVIQNSDGTYILSGYTSSNDGDVSNNAGAKDLWILKVGNTGNIIWEKTFGFIGDDEAFSIIHTIDGGYFLCGYLDVTASGGAGNDGRNNNANHGVGDFWGLKLDVTGNYEWRRYYGGTNNDRAYDVVQTSDNGFLLVGSTESTDVDITNNKGSYDYWLTKIDSNGNLEWQRTLGGSQLDNCYGIAKTQDGNFIVVGDSRSNDFDIDTSIGFADVWVIKISINNEIIWKKSYGGTSFDSARSIVATQDGDFLISGFSRSSDVNLESNFGQNDSWVFKINSDGDLLYQKSIGGTNEDLGNGVTELQNHNIILVGETNSLDNDILTNQGLTDILVVKIK